MSKGSERPFLRAEALGLFNEVVDVMDKMSHEFSPYIVDELIPCGSLRRGKYMVSDVDVAIISSYPDATPIWEHLKLYLVIKKLVQGPKEFRFVYKGLQFDMRNFPPHTKGAALIFCTGSASFNIMIRSKAKEEGGKRHQTWKLNRYGIHRPDFAGKDFNMTAHHTEEGIFKFLGMNYVKPEDRHDYKLEYGMEATVIQVPNSKGTGTYDILNKDGVLSCTCPGFKFRRTCRHVKEASMKI